MNRAVCVFTLVLLIGLSGGLAGAGVGGLGGLPLGLDLPNTSSVDYGYVRIADHDSLEPQVFTIEAWIHPLGNGHGSTNIVGSLIVGKVTEGAMGSALGSWTMFWAPPIASNPEKILVSVVDDLGNSSTSLWSNGTVPMNSSAHVAMSFDGTWLRLFINGVLDNEVQAVSSFVDYGDQDVLIGAANYAAPWRYRFDGIVDEVRIWDYARGEGEIADQMDCVLHGDDGGLLAYYSFNYGDARDDSGNFHHGTLEGLPVHVEFAQPCIVLFDDFETGDTSRWSNTVP